ncbi:MAG: hypothetical protein COB77_00250 [Gammaproteobacteria bacterium]|nr:MAG: hypothetical protein COB77_00250 [Gammaproteobacteria bacterium]
MNNNQQANLQKTNYGGQQGFVLILSLVILAVLTLIGVSSMNSANIELKATANAQHHRKAFDGGESMLEFTLSNPAELLIDWQVTDTTVVQTVTYVLANTSNLSANIRYVGCMVGIGSSLEAGKGFSYGFFQVAGSGSNVSGTATSSQTHGVRYPAASC